MIRAVRGEYVDQRPLAPERTTPHPQLAVRRENDVAYRRQHIRVPSPLHDLDGRHHAVGDGDRHSVPDFCERKLACDPARRHVTLDAPYTRSILEDSDSILGA